MSYYCVTSLIALSWQYRDRKPEVGDISYSYRMTLKTLYIVPLELEGAEPHAPLELEGAELHAPLELEGAKLSLYEMAV